MNDAPQPKPIPDDAVVRRRTIIAIVAAVVLVALIAAGSWLALGRGRSAQQQPKTFKPAQDTTAPVSVSPTASTQPSATTEATGGATNSTSSAEPGASTPKPAVPASVPKVAFRLGQTLYLANEDGTDAVALATSPEGPYAVSPDGKSIAWVDAATQQLNIATMGTGEPTALGAAAKTRPVWLADSSAVLFLRRNPTDGLEVYRAKVSGGTPVLVGTGEFMAAGPDGTVVTGPNAGGADDRTLDIVRKGRRTQISAPGVVTGVAVGSDRILVGVHEPSSAAGVWTYGLDGSNKGRLLVGVPGGMKGSISDLMLSPNGKTLVFAVTGDDGYSRLFAIGQGGGKTRALSIRRDGYPLRWTADSSSIIFIEGNAFQGESTALMRVHPDGSARFMIVSGATL